MTTLTGPDLTALDNFINSTDTISRRFNFFQYQILLTKDNIWEQHDKLPKRILEFSYVYIDVSPAELCNNDYQTLQKKLNYGKFFFILNEIVDRYKDQFYAFIAKDIFDDDLIYQFERKKFKSIGCPDPYKTTVSLMYIGC